MAIPSDPFRTLGLAPGASLDEVKRAYRRLAKANHPDSAGPEALPRFLAIQAAYERLAGEPGAIRLSRRATPRPSWQSDPTRADATRRAYGSRSRRPPDEPGPRRPRRERAPNKATLGSTTYDGAEDEPREPDWTGATWYGTTSGTYWTLNPKEYADPRKHGPEYQARARRRSRETEAGPGVTAGPTEPATPGTRRAEPWWTKPERDGADGAGGESDRADSREEPRFEADVADVSDSPGGSRGRAWDLGARTAAVRDALLGQPPSRPGDRLLVALIAWLPLGLASLWLMGELTGCGRFAASCSGDSDLLIWAVQIAVVAALVLLPWLAARFAVATVAVAAALVPSTVVLSIIGGGPAARPVGAAMLGLISVVAWLVGLAWALRHPSGGADPDPVS
ncbi:MAG: J domain-containing protein [Chloroflexota bacterium]